MWRLHMGSGSVVLSILLLHVVPVIRAWRERVAIKHAFHSTVRERSQFNFAYGYLEVCQVLST